MMKSNALLRRPFRARLLPLLVPALWAVGCKTPEQTASPQAELWIEKLETGDTESRQVAATSLALRSAGADIPFVVPALIKALDDDDQTVRFSAHESLRQLTGQEDIPIHQVEWQKWWDQNQEKFKPNDQDMDAMIRSERAELHNNQGIAYLGKGMLRAAEGQFAKAIGLDSSNATFYNNMGLAQYHQGRYENAVAMFDTAIQKNPKLGMAYMNLAQIYEDLGDYERAAEVYKQAIERDNESARLYKRPLGVNWAAHHRLARVYLKRAINVDAALLREPHPMLQRLGDPNAVPGQDPTLDGPGRRREIMAELQDLGRGKSDAELLRLAQDEALRRAQKNNFEYFQRAATEAELAAEMRPDLPEIYVTLALARYGAEQYYQAWRAVERVYELGCTWAYPDFVLRVLEERKKMDEDFTPPAWVKDVKRRAAAMNGRVERTDPMDTTMPSGYRRGNQYVPNDPQ